MTLRYGLQEFAKNAELSECRFHASDGIPFVMPDDGDVERLLPPPAQTAPLPANTYASFKEFHNEDPDRARLFVHGLYTHGMLVPRAPEANSKLPAWCLTGADSPSGQPYPQQLDWDGEWATAEVGKLPAEPSWETFLRALGESSRVSTTMLKKHYVLPAAEGGPPVASSSQAIPPASSEAAPPASSQAVPEQVPIAGPSGTSDTRSRVTPGPAAQSDTAVGALPADLSQDQRRLLSSPLTSLPDESALGQSSTEVPTALTTVPDLSLEEIKSLYAMVDHQQLRAREMQALEIAESALAGKPNTPLYDVGRALVFWNRLRQAGVFPGALFYYMRSDVPQYFLSKWTTWTDYSELFRENAYDWDEHFKEVEERYVNDSWRGDWSDHDAIEDWIPTDAELQDLWKEMEANDTLQDMDVEMGDEVADMVGALLAGERISIFGNSDIQQRLNERGGLLYDRRARAREEEAGAIRLGAA